MAAEPPPPLQLDSLVPELRQQTVESPGGCSSSAAGSTLMVLVLNEQGAPATTPAHRASSSDLILIAAGEVGPVRDAEETAYRVFNARDTEAAAELVHPEVDWAQRLGGAGESLGAR